MPHRWEAKYWLVTRYVLALVAAGAGLLLRSVLERWTGPGLPAFITFFPMIMLAALAGGFGPGLVATLASALMADYWIISPHVLFRYGSPVDSIGLAFFTGMGVFMSVVAWLYRRIRGNLEELVKARTAELERANTRLRQESAGHQQARETLRASEARLRFAQQAANAGAWEWDLYTNANVWSEELWHVYGLEPHSCQPTYEAWLNTVHPDDRAMVARAVQDAARHGTDLAAEWRVQNPDGTHRWLMSRGQPVRDVGGTVVRYIGIVMDISNRKRAENALRESEERYRNLFNRMTEGFALHEILCDDKGTPVDYRFLDINPAFETLTGLKREKVVGRTHNEVMPGDDPHWVATCGAVALTGEPQHFENYSRALKRQYEVFAYRPAMRQFAVLFRDVTERREAEKGMEAALRDKSVLLQELYHRVKNNMHLIVSMLNLQSVKLANPVAARAFKDTQDRILSMALVHEKLYRSGNLSEIDLKDYLQDLLQLLSRSCQGEHPTVAVVSSLEPVQVSIDSAIPCGLIVSELVTNAFKHAFPVGRNGIVTVRMRPAGNEGIELLIADDGTGLPKGFDFRTSDSLGLQSVIALVEHQLSGRMERGAGTGTTFRIVFKEPRQKARL